MSNEIINQDLFSNPYKTKLSAKKKAEKPVKEVVFTKKGTIQEVVQFKPSIVIQKSKFVGTMAKAPTQDNENSLQNLTGEASGYLNVASAKPLKNRTVNLALAYEHSIGFEVPLVSMANGQEVAKEQQKYVMPDSGKPYLTFVTLTLPAFQRHTDVQLTNIFLEQFLRTMREQWGVQQYVWRKEPQEDTGGVHFHVLADRYIDYMKIRKRWNDIMNEHGYIRSYRLRQLNHHGYNNEIELGIEERRRISRKLVQFVKYARKTGKLSAVTIPQAKAYVQRQVGKTDYYGPEKAMQDALAMQIDCFNFSTQWKETDKNMASFKGHVERVCKDGWINPKAETELKQLLFRLVKQNKKGQNPKAVFKANLTEFQKIDKDIQLRRFKANVADNFGNPNSTDIHKIKDLRSVSSYLSKYIAKESEVDTSWIDFKTQKIEKREMLVTQRIKNRHTKEVEEIQVMKEVDCLITFETVQDFGREITQEVKAEIYEPRYKSRAVGGKLWGCSADLRQDFVTYPEVISKEIGMYENEMASENEQKLKFDFEYGNNEAKTAIDALRVFVGAEVVEEMSKKMAEEYGCRDMTFFPLWKNYEENGKNKVKAYKCSEVLKELSPPMYEAYDQHYKNLFASLYPEYSPTINTTYQDAA